MDQIVFWVSKAALSFKNTLSSRATVHTKSPRKNLVREGDEEATDRKGGLTYSLAIYLPEISVGVRTRMMA